MAIGLTTEQLLQNFSEYSKQWNLRLTASVLTAEAGVNPDMSSFVENFRKKFPNIPDDILIGIMSWLFAFMDTIVSNNEELAKTIPHVER